MAYSQRVVDLVAGGNRYYGNKDFELASEYYSDACAAFNEENGKDDADLLFLYGKALFQNGVLKSGVLGGTTDLQSKESSEEQGNDKDYKHNEANFQFHDDATLAEGELEEKEHENPKAKKENEAQGERGENDIDDEKEKSVEQESEEEKSDFEIAWDVLDVVRSMFEEKLEEYNDLQKNLSPPFLESEKDVSGNAYVNACKKLSETYDLLGEVSLEAENFTQSAEDLEKCLELRRKLFSEDSSLISESHYKLSLALEFCIDDPELRGKAAQHMKLAIDSVKQRTAKESDPKKKQDDQELIQDLELRYQEMLHDPAQELESEKTNIIKGILGEGDETTDSSSAEKVSTKSVNDLTSFVKRKISEQSVNNLNSVSKKRKKESK